MYKILCFWFLIKAKLLANYWRLRILVCLQSVVTNAINIRANQFSARTLGAGLDRGVFPIGWDAEDGRVDFAYLI